MGNLGLTQERELETKGNGEPIGRPGIDGPKRTQEDQLLAAGAQQLWGGENVLLWRSPAEQKLEGLCHRRI